MVTNTWIAVTHAQGTSVGVYDPSTSGFREIIVNGNELVGTPSATQQKAFNLTNGNINVSINNNILQSLNGGTVFSKSGSISNNVIPDGTSIIGYPKFTTKTFYPTQTALNAFQVKSTIIELYASILGTSKVLKATGNVDASGNINLNVDASNGIKLGSSDPTSGTVSVYTDEGNYTKMQLVAKVYPSDHLSN